MEASASMREILVATTTISDLKFSENAIEAARASESGPVFITEHGIPSHVLLSFSEYRKMAQDDKNILELLSMPEGVDICEEFDAVLERPKEFHKPVEFD
jgi:PHD/YefM family antitoxin component YafN of YafNO toxin-antitoxin module